MKITKVSYQTYMIVCGAMICSIENTIGQTFDLAKNKLRNSKGEIIIFYHSEKLAYSTNYYDADYFLTNNPAAKPYVFDNVMYLR